MDVKIKQIDAQPVCHTPAKALVALCALIRHSHLFSPSFTDGAFLS